MATAIGDLVVNLRMNSGAFSKGIGGATSTLKRFAGIAAGLVGAGSLGLLIRNSFQAIDVVGKMADRIGASTEFITSMGFAAEQSGESTDSMNKALERFSKNIGNAQQGLTAPIRALEQLGLSVEDVAGKPFEQTFKLVADRIAAVEDKTIQAAVATDLFGRVGLKMINMLQGGSAGLEAFEKEAERLGITFSRIDAAKVEAANDAMNRVKRSIGGVVNSLTIELAPAIEVVADSWTNNFLSAVEKSKPLLSDLKFLFQNFADVASLRLLDLVSVGLHAFPQLDKPIAQTVAVFIGAWAGAKAFFSTIIDNMIGGLMELKNVGEAIVAGMSAAFQSIKAGDITGAAGAFGDAFLKTFANQQDVNAPNSFKEFGKAFEQAQKDTLDKFKSAGGLTGFVDQERERIQQRLAERAAEFDKAQAPANIQQQHDEKKALTPALERGPLEGKQQGSKEAFDSILKASMGADPIPKEQLKEAKATNKLLADVKAEVKKQTENRGNEVVVGTFA